MEKFLTALLVTFGLVILHNVTSVPITESQSSGVIFSEISFQENTLLYR